MSSNTDGNENSALGAYSLNANTTGDYNLALGGYSLYTNTTGDKNTAIGHFADVSNDNLINATAIGYNAKVGSSNTIKLGNNSIDSVVTTGKLKLGNIIYPNTDSTAGLFLTTNGSGNIIWANASPLTNAVSATTTNTNIFDLNSRETSYNDMNVFSANNIRVGNDALKSVTTGIANTAVGDSAMMATDQGGANVAIGYKSMFKNQTGNFNTAVGTYSLYENTSGRANSAFGNLALSSNTIGELNSAFGLWALKSNTEGDRNTAMGAGALRENITGDFNTASGRAALQNNTVGIYNTSLGFQALFSNVTGSNNTAVGSLSNVSQDNLTNATAIGYGAIVNASNTIKLGNSDVENVATNGTITAGSVTYPNTHNSTAGQVLTISESGVATWTTGFQVAYNEIKTNSMYTGSLAMTSDSRLKSNIKALPTTLDIIKKLNPVSYKKKDSIFSSQYSHDEMGFIAQEIQKVLPQVVVEGKDKDKILSVNYISLIPVLTKAIQEQQQQIEEQTKSNSELKKQMDRQQKEIDELKALIKSIKK